MGGEKFKDLEHVLHTSYRVLLTQDVYMERAAGKMREAEHGESLNGVGQMFGWEGKISIMVTLEANRMMGARYHGRHGQDRLRGSILCCITLSFL